MRIREFRLYRAAKSLAIAISIRAGLGAISRWLNRDKVLVLIYHDVLPSGFDRANPIYGMTVTKDDFAWQMEWIAKRYSPISLEMLRSWLLDRKPIPEFAVLVTFDDGHRNFIENALPILRHHGLRAACFAVADSLGGGSKRTWCESLYEFIMTTDRNEVAMSDGRRFQLNTKVERAEACGAIFDVFRKMPIERQLLELQHLGVGIDASARESHESERFESFTAQDLAILKESNVELQSHGCTHRILSTLSEGETRTEMQASRELLEAYMDSRVYALAYPFGENGLDFASREERLARETGYDMAFAGSGGLVGATVDRFAIPRIGIGPCSRVSFAFLTSGLHHATAPLRRLMS